MKKIILMLCVLLAVVTAWAWYERQQNALYHSPFFKYEFDPARNVIRTYWKGTGRLVELGFDRNDDLGDDPVVVIAPSGKTATIMVDEDHNGYMEVQYVCATSGVIIAKYEDIGQDGYFEEYVKITADSTFSYRDRNEDGQFTSDEQVAAEPMK